MQLRTFLFSLLVAGTLASMIDAAPPPPYNNRMLVKRASAQQQHVDNPDSLKDGFMDDMSGVKHSVSTTVHSIKHSVSNTLANVKHRFDRALFPNLREHLSNKIIKEADKIRPSVGDHVYN